MPEQDVPATALASPAPGEAKKRLDILLAEDDPLNQLFMQSILKKLGHAVTLANNGQETLDLLKQNGFDCILMDIQMPVMTGDEATRRIRAAEVQGSRFSGSAVEEAEIQRTSVGRTGGRPSAVVPDAKHPDDASAPTVNREPGTVNQRKRIPIIAVTAHTQPGDREKFLAAGMDDYLGEPVRARRCFLPCRSVIKHRTKRTIPLSV
jgi:CheY-like chemotaxis protein